MVRAVTAAGGQAVAIRADVTDAGDVVAMVDETERRWGRRRRVWCTTLIPSVTSFDDLAGNNSAARPPMACCIPHSKSRCAGDDEQHGRLVYLSTGLSRRRHPG